MSWRSECAERETENESGLAASENGVAASASGVTARARSVAGTASRVAASAPGYRANRKGGPASEHRCIRRVPNSPVLFADMLGTLTGSGGERGGDLGEYAGASVDDGKYAIPGSAKDQKQQEEGDESSADDVE